jgi:phosphoglycerate dehydrogenase-like enzyme
MNLLISIQQPVRAWQIPLHSVQTIRDRFPDVHITHATDEGARAQALVDCDVAFTWLMSEAELATCTRLNWVHTSAVAVETFCLPQLFARNVIVTNSRGVQSAPIAEHVFAVLLALAKRLPYVVDQQRDRHWAQNEMVGDRLPWLLKGKTLGLIGFGTIGAEIARLASAFGMKIVAITRRARTNHAHDIEWLTPSQLGELLKQSDVLVIAAPLTPETLNMIGPSEIAQMRRGSVLINVGRARIINHPALNDALRSGHLGGASLDVFHREPLPADDPLWSAPNIIITPHTSGFRQGHWEDVIDLFSENLRRYQRGEPVRFRVEPALGY